MKNFRLMIMFSVLPVLLTLLPSPACGEDAAPEEYEIPAVVNQVGDTDCSDIDAAIKRANEILGKGKEVKSRIDVKHTNKNVTVGNGDNTLTKSEVDKLKDDGKKELADTDELKGPNGKWHGRGVKIYVADDCWFEKPRTNGWTWHDDQCICIEPNRPSVERLGRTIAHEHGHAMTLHDTYDPNFKDNLMYGTSAGGTDIPPKDEEEMKNGLPHIAIPFKGTTIKPLPKPGKPSEQTPKREITANGFVLDELYDTSAMDPCDVFFAYADVHNVSLVAVGVTEPNSQTQIRIVLNGSFPGSPTGVMQVPNPDRDFEATYSIMFCDVPDKSINLRVWKSGGGDLQTEAWREDGGGTTYYDNDPVLAESEIHLSWEEGYYDPNVKITPNHKIELEVASDDFFGPGSDPFDGGVCAYVESTADDSMLPGTPINDSTEEFVYGFVSACDIPSMYFIGPSAEPNGLGLGIAGEGLDANTPLEITLDDAPIGDCNSNAGGQFMFFMDNSTPMINGPHTVEVYQLEEHGDGTTTKGPSITGTFLYCAEGEPNGDFDGDCDVDFGDFSYFAANWLAGTDD